MYSDFFRLKEPPFSITPDPRYLYLSKRHQEALAHLLYGTGEEGGFVELTGEVGTGKTTLIRALLQSRLERVDVALILNPRLTVSEFVASICDELGVARSERTYTLKPLIDALNQHLLKSHGRGRQTVLIVDEAQNLSLDVLEQVRLLTNLETSRHKLLRIILVGQPELKHVLDRHDMRQLAQRITARFHLEPLDRSETGNYIAHRLEVAGGPPDLISPKAVRRVHHYARGIPRLINVICDRALLGAYANGQRFVDQRLINRAAREALGGSYLKRQCWTPYRVLAAGATAAALTGAGVATFTLLDKSEQADERELASEFSGAEFATVMEDDPTATDRAPAAAADHAALPAQLSGMMSAPLFDGRTAAPESADREATPAAAGVGGDDVLLTKIMVENAPPPVPDSEDPIESAPWVSGEPAPEFAGVERAATESENLELSIGLVQTLDQAAAVTRSDDLTGLSSRLLTLEADNLQAFRRMFELWGEVFEPGDDGDLCSKLIGARMRCFKGPTSWAELRGWNRPAVLRLFDQMGQTREVLLRALDRTHATLELGSSEPMRFPIAEVDGLWAGHASVLWKLQTSVALFAEGARGEPVLWLRKHLSLLYGGGAATPADPAFYDSVLASRVKRFQADRGLKADGIVGQRTMLYLNNLDPLPGTPMLRLSDAHKAG